MNFSVSVRHAEGISLVDVNGRLTGIGELVRNYMSVVKKNGVMKVVGLAPKVEEILKVTQLYQVFPEFPDEASALESFSALRNTTSV